MQYRETIDFYIGSSLFIGRSECSNKIFISGTTNVEGAPIDQDTLNIISTILISLNKPGNDPSSFIDISDITKDLGINDITSGIDLPTVNSIIASAKEEMSLDRSVNLPVDGDAFPSDVEYLLAKNSAQTMSVSSEAYYINSNIICGEGQYLDGLTGCSSEPWCELGYALDKTSHTCYKSYDIGLNSITNFKYDYITTSSKCVIYDNMTTIIITRFGMDIDALSCDGYTMSMDDISYTTIDGQEWAPDPSSLYYPISTEVNVPASIEGLGIEAIFAYGDSIYIKDMRDVLYELKMPKGDNSGEAMNIRVLDDNTYLPSHVRNSEEVSIGVLNEFGGEIFYPIIKYSDGSGALMKYNQVTMTKTDMGQNIFRNNIQKISNGLIITTKESDGIWLKKTTNGSDFSNLVKLSELDGQFHLLKGSIEMNGALYSKAIDDTNNSVVKIDLNTGEMSTLYSSYKEFDFIISNNKIYIVDTEKQTEGPSVGGITKIDYNGVVSVVLTGQPRYNTIISSGYRVYMSRDKRDGSVQVDFLDTNTDSITTISDDITNDCPRNDLILLFQLINPFNGDLLFDCSDPNGTGSSKIKALSSSGIISTVSGNASLRSTGVNSYNWDFTPNAYEYHPVYKNRMYFSNWNTSHGGIVSSIGPDNDIEDININENSNNTGGSIVPFLVIVKDNLIFGGNNGSGETGYGEYEIYKIFK
jgi:hypothetical protein